jgi:hypothetical protein
VSLKASTKTADVTPFLAGNATASAVNGSQSGESVTLALADPDSGEVVPSDAPSFAGDYMLDSQSDEELVFAPASGQDPKVLQLINSVGDSAWATSANGTLYVTDAASDVVDAVTGPFTPGTMYTAVTPCDASGAPSTCSGSAYESNFLGTINMKTGVITEVNLDTALNPQGMIFVP